MEEEEEDEVDGDQQLRQQLEQEEQEGGLGAVHQVHQEEQEDGLGAFILRKKSLMFSVI